MHSSIHIVALWLWCMLQFSSLNVDRVGGVYLMEYLSGIGQQLVQMIYISPVVNIYCPVTKYYRFGKITTDRHLGNSFLVSNSPVSYSIIGW